MCRLCNSGHVRDHHPSAGSARVLAAVAEAGSGPAGLPRAAGAPGSKTLIRGGMILSMDRETGDFATGDVLITGNRIAEIAPRIDAPDAHVIDASGKIVMPGFIDTHSHQFETALRATLADAILSNDGRPGNDRNYVDTMLQAFSLVYRPEDVYINELFAGLSQIDAGVTTVLDVSQIHHSPAHSDAAIQGLRDAGRRAAFGYFEGWGERTQYPTDAARIRKEHFASDDQLVTMVMGGEIYLDGHEHAWDIGRELGVPVAAHVQDFRDLVKNFDRLSRIGKMGPDNIFIHMTNMPDTAWRQAADAGAKISLSVPIEMHMRHGEPPIQKALDHGMTVSLSSDVECTMTSDFFTQMRSLITLQRMRVNEAALAGATDHPDLMRCVQAIRHATIEGARTLGLEGRTGSLAPGKDADIILLDAEALNVVPMNHVPGTVVTLMDRSNVDTVMVAGRILKWKGRLVGHDTAKLRRELEASRDHIFAAAGIEKDLFA